jgi:ABC-type glycerol-3-phosphate transport system substrate-binding protein
MSIGSIVSRRALLRSVVVTAISAPVISACAGAQPPPTPAPAAPTTAPAAKPTTAPAAAPTTAPAAPTTASTPAPTTAATTVPVAAPAKASGPVQLRWGAWANNEVEYDNVLTIVNRYRDVKKKDVKVQIEVTTFEEGYITKLIAQVASKTLPDIFTSHSGMNHQMAEAGVPMNLSNFLRGDDELKIDDFAPSMLNLGRYPQPNGDVYMISRAMDVMLLFFNRDAFKEVGLPEPTADWTWTQFYDICRKLTKKGASGPPTRYGVGFNYTSPLWHQNFIYAEGGKYISDDATKATIDTPEAIRGMQLAWDGVKEGIFMPNPEQEAMGGAPNGFALGKLGILAGARWSVPGLRANVKTFDWDAVVMPKGSVRRAANSGTVGYSIASTTRTPADTWDLLKFVYSPQGWEVLAESYSVVPPVKQLYNSPIWRDLPPPPKNNQAFIDASSDAVFVPYTFFADSAAIDKAVGNVFDKFIAGTPLDVAAKASNQDLQKQLDDYRQKKK